MRVLIVEDEVRLAEALGQIMAEHRYLADLVYTGPDGLEYGLTNQYDVIVLDVMLPSMDGLALARRQGEVRTELLTYADLTLNLSTRCLRCGVREVRLGFKEFEVLRLLIAYPKMVVPKEEIILKVWGADSNAEDNNVEVYVSFLRKKLLFLESGVTIRTVRKVGYFLEVEEP